MKTLSTRQEAKNELAKRSTNDLEKLFNSTWPATVMKIGDYETESDYRRVLILLLSNGVYFGKVTL